MKTDPRCPIDVMDYEILADDRGRARAYIKLKNVSSRAVDSLSADVYWSDGAGESYETSINAYDLVAPPGEEFTLTASTDRPLFPISLIVRFTSISFESEQNRSARHSRMKRKNKPLDVTLPFDADARPAPDGGAERAKKLVIRRTVVMLSLGFIIALAALIWRLF